MTLGRPKPKFTVTFDQSAAHLKQCLQLHGNCIARCSSEELALVDPLPERGTAEGGLSHRSPSRPADDGRGQLRSRSADDSRATYVAVESIQKDEAGV